MLLTQSAKKKITIVSYLREPKVKQRAESSLDGYLAACRYTRARHFRQQGISDRKSTTVLCSTAATCATISQSSHSSWHGRKTVPRTRPRALDHQRGNGGSLLSTISSNPWCVHSNTALADRDLHRGALCVPAGRRGRMRVGLTCAPTRGQNNGKWKTREGCKFFQSLCLYAALLDPWRLVLCGRGD